MTQRKPTTLLQIARKPDLPVFPWPARTGVSLHCHTSFSKEMLDFIPQYAAKIPVVAGFFRREQEKYFRRFGRKMDFSRAWWTPPLSASEVWTSEVRQIEERLQLRGLVSITDHDCIGAGKTLRVITDEKTAPISLEWTVPYGGGFFHFGVHNLPADQADEIHSVLIGYTNNAASVDLRSLLAMLNSIPGVLLVLNHPLWDIEMIGEQNHRQALKSLLEEYGTWVHAFEANGFRSWRENEEVIQMGNDLGFPVVAGGDRHGCQPNTIINLTRSESFPEFIDEVKGGHSKVLVLPEYNEAMFARIIEAVAEILRTYPDHREDSREWHERIFIRDEFGIAKSLGYRWEKGIPLWVSAAVKITCLIGNPMLQPAWKALIRGEEVRIS